MAGKIKKHTSSDASIDLRRLPTREIASKTLPLDNNALTCQQFTSSSSTFSLQAKMSLTSLHDPERSMEAQKTVSLPVQYLGDIGLLGESDKPIKPHMPKYRVLSADSKIEIAENEIVVLKQPPKFKIDYDD